MVVAGSFSSTFARNSINNALMTLELPRLVDKLRQRFPPSKEDEQFVLTRRTGWTLTWDFQRSVIEVHEGVGGEMWTEKVGELPPTVQAIIASGGLEAHVKTQVAAQKAS